MAKVVLDEQACFGCGLCAGNNPEHFDFVGDEGHATVINDAVDDGVREIAESCPAQCISIVEEENN